MAKCTKCGVGSLYEMLWGHRSNLSEWRNPLRLPRGEVGGFGLEMTVRHSSGSVAGERSF